MPQSEIGARTRSYRAIRTRMWTDLVQQHNAYIEYYQEHEGLGLGGEAIDESRFRAPVNLFLGALLTHSSRGDATSLSRWLPAGWGTTAEIVLYRPQAQVSAFIDRSLPDRQWGQEVAPAVAADATKWEAWLRGQLETLGVPSGSVFTAPVLAPKSTPAPQGVSPWRTAVPLVGGVALTISRLTLAGLAATESLLAARRWQHRRDAFAAATRRALALGRPLVVIGDPNAGAHTRLMPAYGCGDLCVDLQGCPRCHNFRAADITKGPIAGVGDDSAVVFVSCVFEYVGELRAAIAEVERIAGDPRNVFVVTVQPYTFTAALYPGARWTGTTPETMKPVTTWHKFGASAALAALVLGAVWPRGHTR